MRGPGSLYLWRAGPTPLLNTPIKKQSKLHFKSQVGTFLESFGWDGSLIIQVRVIIYERAIFLLRLSPVRLKDRETSLPRDRRKFPRRWSVRSALPCIRCVLAASFLVWVNRADPPFQSMFQPGCNSERLSSVTSVEVAVCSWLSHQWTADTLETEF